MAETHDLLHIVGDPEDFEGNRQLILDDENAAWLITEGTVHVFVAKRGSGGVIGRRHYVSEFAQGDILFGTHVDHTYENESVVLLCMGVVNGKIARINRSDISKLLIKEEKAKLIFDSVHKWISVLTESALNVNLQEWSTKEIVYDQTIMEELKKFHKDLMESAAYYITNICNDEDKKIRDKQNYNESSVQEALIELTKVVRKNKKKKNTVAEGMEYNENPLVAACQIVGNAMGINISVPVEEVMMKSKDILFDVVRNSHIRYRQIILADGWWKTDNGPFLAFLEDDDTPVAIVPVKNNSYKIVNTKNCVEIAVDDETARTIKPKAYMFYKTLPNKELNVKDLIRFCFTHSLKMDIAAIIVIGILGGIVNTFIPIANGILFNYIIPEGEREQLIQVASIMLSLSFSGGLFQLVRSFVMVRIESKVDVSLQAAVWDRVLSLPVPFFRRFTAGELTMRTMGISQIRKTLSGAVITTVLSALFSMFHLIILFKYSRELAFYTLFLLALTTAFAFGCCIIQLRYKRKLTQITNVIAGQVLQIIEGITKFRVAGAEKRAFLQWSKAFGKQRDIEYKTERIENILITFQLVSPVVISMILFATAFHDVNLAAGNFIAFNSAFLSCMTATISLSSVMLTINSIIPTYESIEPILKTVPEYDDIKEDPGELDGSIELSHITFRYQPDLPAVLSDLSFKINKGEYVAIVGPSGCGKSTILRLLLGFEKAEEGKIYYGGHDIENSDIRSIRKQLGVVMQNSQIMSGDIRTNIIGTNPNLSLEDAIEAAKLAGIYEDIEAMPMGMFTIVSEGGSTLSGGQRQRILIARVLANKPKIIFFDEATSALDNRTQAIVSKSLDSLKATRIVIAHRLSTIMNCDRIVVVDHGRIIEEGSYGELMAKESVFYELARRQLA